MENNNTPCMPNIDYKRELEKEHERLLMMEKKCENLTEAIVSLTKFIEVESDEKERFHLW